jgi:hypothetical protein
MLKLTAQSVEMFCFTLKPKIQMLTTSSRNFSRTKQFVFLNPCSQQLKMQHAGSVYDEDNVMLKKAITCELIR